MHQRIPLVLTLLHQHGSFYLCGGMGKNSLYVDECHNVKGRVLADVLSEARKYALALILSHQYTSQLTPAMQDAIFGNAGSQIVFRLSGGDSAVFAREFGHALTTADLTSLPVHQAYVRLSVNGETSQPFSMHTLPPSPPHGHKDTIIRTSRQRFGRPREVVERSVRKLVELPQDDRQGNKNHFGDRR